MNDWPVRTLGDICRIEMGRTPSRGDSKGWDKAFKTTNHWASIADLTACNGRVLTSTKERISDYAAKTTKVVPAGTLMMSFKLSIGKLAFAGCDLYTNEAIAAFHLHEESGVDSDYLYWALSVVDWSALTKGSEKVKGATMNKAKLNLLEIPVPPLEEQKRIVELLDAATAHVTELTACYEQARTHASNLFTSALRELIDDLDDTVVMTLADICTVDWGNTNLTKKSYLENGNYLAVSAAGPDGRIGHAEHKAFTPVLSAIGARCGRMFLPEEDFTAIKNTITLTPKSAAASGKYIYFLVERLTLPTRGAAQPFIAKGDIEKFEVAVPPMNKQVSIVERLELVRSKTSEMVAAYDAKLNAAKNLRQSILEAAFAGDL